ncbi:hypothetical protein VNI00_006698 [Paramarasmius palmivorus]|uniref:Uncharacterized protein n=1 Tax=Paramarasmius palmivorus TaxID=297713 RepID=A0AAW0DB09_9AGAR
MKVVVKNWPTSIGIWFKYLLDGFVLGDEEPNTPQGLEFRDDILAVLPDLFRIGGSLDERIDYVRAIFRDNDKSLGMISLVARVWMKLLDMPHTASFQWASFVAGTFYTHETQVPNELEEYLTSSKDSDLVGVAIRHMSRFAMQCRNSLPDFNVVSELTITMIVSETCFDSSSPRYRDFVSRGGITALVKVLSGVLSQRMISSYLTIGGTDESPDTTLMIIRACLNLLVDCLESRAAVMEALVAGLLKAVVRAVGVYDMGDSEDSKGHSERKLGDMIANVLQRVSRFIAYPPVYRRFKRSIQKYVNVEWEESLPESNKYLSDVWNTCLDNMGILEDILSAFMGSKWPLLFNPVRAMGPPQSTVIARPAEWRFIALVHARKGIGQHTKKNALGYPTYAKPVLNDIERQVFNELVRTYVYIFNKYIKERLDSCNKANPVVVLDFDEVIPESKKGLRLVDLSCLQVHDRSEIIQDTRLSPSHVEAIQKCPSPDDPSKALVLAFFPAPWFRKAQFVLTIIEIPEVSDSDTDSEGWSSDME